MSAAGVSATRGPSTTAVREPAGRSHAGRAATEVRAAAKGSGALRSAAKAIVSREAPSANCAAAEIVSVESSPADRAAAKVIVAGEAHATAESVTTDEASGATPVPRNEASAKIAWPYPVSAAIWRHCAVSVDAVITVNPHIPGRADGRRRVRTNRSLRIVAGRTAVVLAVVVARRAIVVGSAITWAGLRAIVTWSAAIHVSSELTLRKSPARYQYHRDQFRFHFFTFLTTL